MRQIRTILARFFRILGARFTRFSAHKFEKHISPLSKHRRVLKKTTHHRSFLLCPLVMYIHYDNVQPLRPPEHPSLRLLFFWRVHSFLFGKTIIEEACYELSPLLHVFQICTSIAPKKYDSERKPINLYLLVLPNDRLIVLTPLTRVLGGQNRAKKRAFGQKSIEKQYFWRNKPCNQQTKNNENLCN